MLKKMSVKPFKALFSSLSNWFPSISFNKRRKRKLGERKLEET